MNTLLTRCLFNLAILGLSSFSTSLQAGSQKPFVPSAATFSNNAYNCAADATWFSAPSMPTEVKKSAADGSSNFCDFYQFSWQAFAYLMTPVSQGSDVRNFDDASQFPELEVDADGKALDSCHADNKGSNLFIRLSKPASSGTEFVIPERIGQAGGGATIYDQSGNVVYYDVRFSQNICDDLSRIKQSANFPGGTTELKTAWKVLTNSDVATDYITIEADIGGEGTTTRLGMIGFHIAAATPDHPEFVWATFEHNINVPNCVAPSVATGWSFASQDCTAALQAKNVTDKSVLDSDILEVVQCRFNNPSPQTNHKKVSQQTPTEICREYPYGSAIGDANYAENVGDIVSLNSNVQQYLTGDYSVLKNYFNLGALWVSDITQSSDINNQRGSLRLANSVMETDFQNVNPQSQGFISNCFGCHNYTGTSTPAAGKNTTSGSLSHIFDDIAIGAGQCLDVQTQQIVGSQSAAKSQCSKACSNSSSQLSWNGQWTNQDAQTGQQLPMTVCGCCGT